MSSKVAINFSSFVATARLPLILSFPVMKALAVFIFPVNILWKLSKLIVRVTSAGLEADPLPQAPGPFFKSK